MIAERVLRESRILVVDDHPTNVLVLERMLTWSGYVNIESTCSAVESVELFARYDPDLLILDLHMPNMSGYEVLEKVRQLEGAEFVPVLVFTADMTRDARDRALELGASDFLTKPGDATEIGLRVRNFLQIRHLTRAIEEKNRELEHKVAQRTMALWTSQIEVLDRLGRVADLRQKGNRDHTKHVAELSAEIALHLGWDKTCIELLRLAAPLHDIGTLTTPGQLLSKRELTPEEDAIVRKHTEIGARILEEGRTPLLQMAEMIARSHHEAWDGSGYPEHLAREAIPEAARIVAVADSYVRMITNTLDSPAIDPDEAVSEILQSGGTKFDPKVLRAFVKALDTVDQKCATLNQG